MDETALYPRKRTMDEVFRAEVKRRVDEFGMTREQAEMLVAVLMWDSPTPSS